MIQLISVDCMGNFISYSRLVHIQPLKLIFSNCVLAHANELNPSIARILACIFGKALSFPKFILKVGTMRLKDINHISNTLVSSYYEEVRIGRLDFSIDFI